MRTEENIHETTVKKLLVFKDQMYNEWFSILKYWSSYTIDEEHGGFYGSVDNNDIAKVDSAKGIVLNSRILWTFSASSFLLKNKLGKEIADRAFNYINDHFVDEEFGGTYWSVDYKGNVLDSRKQIYGLSFCIYGMSEYYRLTRNQAALDLCISLFNCIEQYSYDSKYGGYYEAFSREWKTIDDMRLSEKDDNQKKTMNSHLHIIEAYTNLYRVWPDDELKKKIVGLLDIFDKHIINKDSYHLNLFFDEQWKPKSSLVSYGHDIEASWLLLQCAETVEKSGYKELFKKYAIEIAYSASEGLANDGGLLYEYEPLDGQLIAEKHSWPQAEAMIGFFNVYQLTGKIKYLQHALKNWEFINEHIIDKKNGEWFWGVDENNVVMAGKDKAGFWKCPYHNTRACMELISRIEEIVKKKIV